MNDYKLKMSKKPDIYTYDDITRQMEYDSKKILNKFSNGQLKLLLCELQFFSIININHLCSTNKTIDVIYIGSGKGYHIPILISILSLKNRNIKWHLYDPYGHCKRLNEITTKNININDRIFLEEDIIFFKNYKNIVFISDIRSCEKSEPTAIELLNDYVVQNNILITLQPRYSLIKFRYPFPPDLKKTNFESYSYPKGIMYLQCYNKSDSAELRIFIDNPNKEITFKKFSMDDAKIFEEKLYWYNSIYRFTHNNDILIAGYILHNLNIYNEDEKIIDIINKLILEIDDIKKYDGIKIKNIQKLK